MPTVKGMSGQRRILLLEFYDAPAGCRVEATGKWCLPCPLGIACPFGIVVFSSSERRITISTSSGSRSDDVGMVMQLSDMIR